MVPLLIAGVLFLLARVARTRSEQGGRRLQVLAGGCVTAYGRFLSPRGNFSELFNRWKRDWAILPPRHIRVLGLVPPPQDTPTEWGVFKARVKFDRAGSIAAGTVLAGALEITSFDRCTHTELAWRDAPLGTVEPHGGRWCAGVFATGEILARGVTATEAAEMFQRAYEAKNNRKCDGVTRFTARPDNPDEENPQEWIVVCPRSHIFQVWKPDLLV